MDITRKHSLPGAPRTSGLTFNFNGARWQRTVVFHTRNASRVDTTLKHLYDYYILVYDVYTSHQTYRSGALFDRPK